MKRRMTGEEFNHYRNLLTKSARGGAKSVKNVKEVRHGNQALHFWPFDLGATQPTMMALGHVFTPLAPPCKAMKWLFVQFKRSMVLTRQSNS
jgi:hypothetical protein